MARRVYEVARELGLSTKEVMGRLNDAGVGAKSNLSVVEDPDYERVFGDASADGGAASPAPNGRPRERVAGAPPRGVARAPRKRRSRALEAFLWYVLIPLLAFVVAAGVGAAAALVF